MRSMGIDHVLAMSERIREKVEHLPEFVSSDIIASYVATNEEVQTEQIIRDSLSQGKRVLVPKVISRNELLFSEIKEMADLETGTFGLLEPKLSLIRRVPLMDAKLILVPVVAWDERGYRVGHGNAYFDSALSGITSITIGLGFEAQRTDHVPEERHDVPLKMIITEKRIMRFD